MSVPNYLKSTIQFLSHTLFPKGSRNLIHFLIGPVSYEHLIWLSLGAHTCASTRSSSVRKKIEIKLPKNSAMNYISFVPARFSGAFLVNVYARC